MLQRNIHSVYRSVLRRNATAIELRYYLPLFRNGRFTSNLLIHTLLNSPEKKQINIRDNQLIELNKQKLNETQNKSKSVTIEKSTIPPKPKEEFNNIPNNYFTEFKIHPNQVVRPPNFPNIYISLTTTPTRIINLKMTIKSILMQYMLPDKIILNIPHKLLRTGEEYIIPEWLSKCPLIYINRCTDFGPGTKLIGSLDIIKNPNDIIITIDDDIYYPEKMIWYYYNTVSYNKFSNKVYGLAGFLYTRPFTGQTKAIRQKNMAKCDVLEGFASICYLRHFFSDDIKEYTNMPQYVVLSDDLYLNNYLNGKNIIRYVLHFNDCSWFDLLVLEIGNKSDALHILDNQGNRTKYIQCINYFKSIAKSYLL